MSNIVYRRTDIIQRKPVSNFKRHVYEEIAIQIRLWYEQKRYSDAVKD